MFLQKQIRNLFVPSPPPPPFFLSSTSPPPPLHTHTHTHTHTPHPGDLSTLTWKMTPPPHLWIWRLTWLTGLMRSLQAVLFTLMAAVENVTHPSSLSHSVAFVNSRVLSLLQSVELCDFSPQVPGFPGFPYCAAQKQSGALSLAKHWTVWFFPPSSWLPRLSILCCSETVGCFLSCKVLNCVTFPPSSWLPRLSILCCSETVWRFVSCKALNCVIFSPKFLARCKTFQTSRHFPGFLCCAAYKQSSALSFAKWWTVCFLPPVSRVLGEMQNFHSLQTFPRLSTLCRL